MALCLKGFADGHIRVAAFVKILTGTFFRGLDISVDGSNSLQTITSWIRAGEWSLSRMRAVLALAIASRT